MKRILLFLLGLFVFHVNAQILVMETGVVTITHTVTSVSFTNTFADPVVIALPASYDGSHEATVRVNNVTGSGFDLYIEEPENRDGPHTTEDIHWVVVEKGRYTFDDGTMLEAGEVSSSDLNFQTVGLLQTYPAAPAIFTQVQTDAGSTNFLKTRQRNAAASSFQVKLEREEALNGSYSGGSEDIGYFAISKGSGILDGVTYEAQSFSLDEVAIVRTFSETYSAGNHMIASIATFNGGDPANLRWTSLTTTQMRVFVDEDLSNDGESDHALETIDYFVIDGGETGIFLPTLLPIELLSFDAYLTKSAHVDLEWVTASELNNDYFTLERSADGQHWQPIHQRDGAGNSVVQRNYAFTDKSPLLNVSYYRLKQTDFDGTYTYSPVRTINRNAMENGQVNVYPVPTSDFVTIQADATELEGLRIYNALGQDVTREVLFTDSYSTNKRVLDLRTLDAGIYFVKTKSITKKVHKK